VTLGEDSPPPREKPPALTCPGGFSYEWDDGNGMYMPVGVSWCPACLLPAWCTSKR